MSIFNVFGKKKVVTHQPGIKMVIIDFGGTGVDATKLPAIAAALTKQAQQHLALPPPYGYGISATIRVGAGVHDVLPDEWVIGLVAKADQPGALGYHDQTPGGLPFVRVFPLLDAADGGSLSVTLSHEVCEVLVDPNIARAAMGPDGRFWAYESCLAGDTLVRLADGSQVPIETLANRGGFFDVRAVDQNGEIVAARGGHARLTRKAAETVVVRLIDGSVIRCTPEHKFLLADGSFREAENLVSGTELWSDALPVSTSPSSVYSRQGDSVLSGQKLGGLLGASNEANVLDGQLSPVMIFANGNGTAHSTLDSSIEHINCMSSDKEMFGPNTSANIASVADLQTFRNRPEMHSIRDAVGCESYSISDLPVSGSSFSSNPQPARLGFINFRPEPLLEGRSSKIIRTVRNASRNQPAISVLPGQVSRTQLSSLLITGAPNNATQRSELVVPMSTAESDLSFSGQIGASQNRTERNGSALRPMPFTEPLTSTEVITTRNGTKTSHPHAKVVLAVETERKLNFDVFDLTVPKLRNFALSAGVFVHNCDACEADAYLVDGIAVSNFVLPPYYEPVSNLTGLKLDWMGLMKKPLEIRPGGYGQWFDPKRGWQQVVHASKAPRSYRMRSPTRRSEHRRHVHTAID